MSVAHALTPLAKLGDLMPISAQRHAAPTAFMRLGAVIEHQRTVSALAFAHQIEITVSQQLGSSKGQSRQALAYGIRLTEAIQYRCARLLPNQLWHSVQEKRVERRWIRHTIFTPGYQ